MSSLRKLWQFKEVFLLVGLAIAGHYLFEYLY